MTTVTFRTDRERVTGFTCQGHSGYAEAGEDIVCAAVTSAVRLCECTINDVLLAEADVAVDAITAEITLTLSPAGKHRRECEQVLEGLFLYMRELSKENPDHLTVMEV
mgnify:CR=1 FL=1